MRFENIENGDGETDCHDQSAARSRNDIFGTFSAVGAVTGRPPFPALVRCSPSVGAALIRRKADEPPLRRANGFKPVNRIPN